MPLPTGDVIGILADNLRLRRSVLPISGRSATRWARGLNLPRGGETVVKATDSIADVARQNLQVVEGINLAVRQLAAEAETLRKRVEEFTV